MGLRRAGLFPGAACCQPPEQAAYKAAPLHALPISLPLKPHDRIMGELHLINERVKVEKKP
jgi:hypothetical protein